MNDKIAQRLSFWQKHRDKALQSKELKKDFLGSAEYREIVDKLTNADDAVREIAVDLKSLLKSIESNFNRREYMLAVAYLAKFHEKITQIMALFKEISDVIHQQHHAFLFGDLEPEHKEYLIKKLPEWFKKQTKKAELNKDAGLSDWWYSITTDRGKALRRWEKRFPQTARELKSQINSMIGRSKALLATLLAGLKQLGKYRSKHMVEDYVRILPSLQSKYKSYNQAFAGFYDKYIKPYIEAQKAVEEKVQGGPPLTKEKIEEEPSPKSPPPGFSPSESAPKPRKMPSSTSTVSSGKPSPFAEYAPRTQAEADMIKSLREAQEMLAKREQASSTTNVEPIEKQNPKPIAQKPVAKKPSAESKSEEAPTSKPVPTILAQLDLE
jgi:hypothetical protein